MRLGPWTLDPGPIEALAYPPADASTSAEAPLIALAAGDLEQTTANAQPLGIESNVPIRKPS